jgi:hypothetical protein
MDAFLVFVVACFASGFIGGVIGQRKGSSYYVWFLVSLFVPVLGREEVARCVQSMP